MIVWANGRKRVLKTPERFEDIYIVTYKGYEFQISVAKTVPESGYSYPVCYITATNIKTGIKGVDGYFPAQIQISKMLSMAIEGLGKDF